MLVLVNLDSTNNSQKFDSKLRDLLRNLVKQAHLKVRSFSENPSVALKIFSQLSQTGKPVFLRPDELETALVVRGLEAAVDAIDGRAQELPAERLLYKSLMNWK